MLIECSHSHRGLTFGAEDFLPGQPLYKGVTWGEEGGAMVAGGAGSPRPVPRLAPLSGANISRRALKNDDAE